MSVANPKNGVVWSKEEQASKLGAVAEVIVRHSFPCHVVKGIKEGEGVNKDGTIRWENQGRKERLTK